MGIDRLIKNFDSFVPFERGQIEQSIVSRFEAQVRARPGRFATKSVRRALTYAELNTRANQISHSVLGKVGPGNDPVALMVRDETDMIAAILGALKAGKIYLPLDVRETHGRNAAILSESQSRLILTDDASIAGGFDVPSLNIRQLDSGISAEDPSVDLPDDALAYIFYTSGSTGPAKGVADSHRNVLHNIMRYTNSLKISPDDRLTLLQSANFSGSVSSLFCALLNGATSYPFDLKRDGPAGLARWMADEAITMFHAVPSIFRLIATGEHRFPALRVVRLEGDRAHPRDIELFKVHFTDDCVLVNGLGATECGLVRQYFVDKATPAPQGVLPIGYPVQDMNVRIVDDVDREAPAGEVGEIVVQSEYLATGYWRRPDLTEAAFASIDGKRTYRTGDLGRIRADGCLDYLGRKNFHLKVCGQWVDCVEVEQALLDLKLFREAIVQPHLEAENGEPRLIAYLVSGLHERPGAGEIRKRLAARLPAHALPNAFVFLDRLPLDANGKVDRRALRPPARAQIAPSPRGHVPPRNMLQLELQQIWQHVLDARPIGIHDDFFGIGGDSLQAMNLLAKIEHATGKSVSPDVLLGDSTIEKLARYIDSTAAAQRQIVEIQPGTGSVPFYFLHGDYESGGFYTRTLARGMGTDRPVYALPPCGTNGHGVPDSYPAMAAIHLDVLRAHRGHGPYLLGGTCNGGIVAFEMARQLVTHGERVELLVMIGSSASNLRFLAMRRLIRPLQNLVPGGARLESRLLSGIVRRHRSFAKLQSVPLTSAPKLLWNRQPGAVELLRQGFKRNGTARIYERYQQIDREYVPGQYCGNLTLLWSDGEPENAAQAARWWRKVAGNVEVHMLPASPHQEALARHGDTVGRIIRSCIDLVERD